MTTYILSDNEGWTSNTCYDSKLQAIKVATFMMKCCSQWNAIQIHEADTETGHTRLVNTIKRDEVI